MHNQLIIRLNSNPPLKFDWIYLDNQNNRIFDKELIEFEKIQTTNEKYELIVIVPGVDVYLTDIALPEMPNNKLIKAIPFALEEKIATSVHNVHFAVGRPIKKNTYPVAIVDKTKLEIWVTYLKSIFIAKEIHITQIIPDVFALPFEANHWRLYNEHGVTIARTDYHLGFSIEDSEIWKILSLKLKHAKPEGIEWISHEKAPPDIIHSLKENDISFKQIEPNETLLLKMATHASNAPFTLLKAAINPTIKRALRYSAFVLAMISALVIVVGLLLQWMILEWQTHKLQKENQAILQFILPKASITTPNLRKKVMDQISRAGDRSETFLFKTLGIIAPLISQNKIQKIQWQNNILLLNIVFNDDTAFSTFKMCYY